MKKRNLRFIAWVCILILCTTTLLAGCKNNDSKVTSAKTTVESTTKNSTEDSKEVTTAENTTSEKTENKTTEESSEAEKSSDAKDPYEKIEWDAPTPLWEAYKDNFMIGTIYTPNSLNGKDKELTIQHFNAITAENIMKPDAMQRSEGKFSYTQADTMNQFAKDNNITMIGHTLAWHQQSPNWMGTGTDRDKAIAQLKAHVEGIAGHYKDDIYSWDVLNEAINDGVQLPADGDWTKCLRNTQWLKSIGPEYVAMVFEFAREAAPNAILYYNDYNLNDRNKATITAAMVRDLKSQGVPIDGVGMQGHYTSTTSLAQVEASLHMFSELDVVISVTELDAGINNASATGLTYKQEVDQAVFYAKLFQLYKKYDEYIERVTFWGMQDNKSWRSENFPCLFNSDGSPKEAFYAVLNPDVYLDIRSGGDGSPAEKNKIEATKGTPTIDGEKDDVWENAKEANVKIQATAWSGATGKAKTLYDDEYFYILVDVTDFNLDDSSYNEHEKDSVEVYLDQGNEKNAFFDNNDYHYRVNYKGKVTYGTVPTQEGFEGKVTSSTMGYIIECAIPLEKAVKEGQVMGFEVQINDAASGRRQSISKFNDPTDNSYSEPAGWGEVVFK